MTSTPCVSTHLSQHAWALTVAPALSSRSESHQPAPDVPQSVGGGSQSPPSLSWQVKSQPYTWSAPSQYPSPTQESGHASPSPEQSATVPSVPLSESSAQEPAPPC